MYPILLLQKGVLEDDLLIMIIYIRVLERYINAAFSFFNEKLEKILERIRLLAESADKEAQLASQLGMCPSICGGIKLRPRISFQNSGSNLSLVPRSGKDKTQLIEVKFSILFLFTISS